MRTLVLGIGNTILGDDGIGVYVVQGLAKEINDENIDVMDTSIDGLNLLEIIAGYDKLIVVGAIMTEETKAGKIYKLKPKNIGRLASSATSPHHLNLATTIEIGKRLFPQEIPGEVIIFAVGAQEVTEVTEEMTARVKEAIPRVINLVLEELSLKR